MPLKSLLTLLMIEEFNKFKTVPDVLDIELVPETNDWEMLPLFNFDYDQIITHVMPGETTILFHYNVTKTQITFTQVLKLIKVPCNFEN